ncbi:MAG: hypothetical protein Q9203_005172 [Teloschistes exilis]
MEAIGAITSILGVATATVEVSKALHDTLMEIKDAPYEIGRLSGDLQSISSILSSLETTLKGKNGQRVLKENEAIVRALKDLKPPLRICETIIQDIRTKITPCLGLLEGGKGYRLKTKWWWNKDAINSLVARFESAKQTLNIGMAGVSMVCNLRNLPDMDIGNSAKTTIWRSDSADTDAGFALRRYIAASMIATKGDTLDWEDGLDSVPPLISEDDESRKFANDIITTHGAVVWNEPKLSRSSSANSDVKLARQKYTASSMVSVEDLARMEIYELADTHFQETKLLADKAIEDNKEVYKLADTDFHDTHFQETKSLADTVPDDDAEDTKLNLFHRVVRRGLVWQAQAFLSDGVDPNALSSDGLPPLVLAVKSGNIEIVRLLLDLVPVDEGGIALQCGDVVFSAWTPLHYAAARGFSDISILLLGAGAKLDARASRQRVTPLHVAVGHGHTKVAQVLIDSGADILAQDFEQRTPLHYAIDDHHVDIMRIIIKRDADIDAVGKARAPRDLAIQVGEPATIAMLRNAVANSRAQDSDYPSALHTAVSWGDAFIINTLLAVDRQRTPGEKPAYVDMKNVHGYTALHMATYKANTAIIDVLIKAGANPRAQSSDHSTALHTAACWGHARVATMLIADDEQRNPGEEETFLNMKDENGNTALHIAALYARVDIVQLLLERGALTSSKNANGKTAFQHAKSAGHSMGREIVLRLLRDHDNHNGKIQLALPLF